MNSRHANGKAFGLALLVGCFTGFAEASLDDCWTAEVPAQLIDVDGSGKIQGAWNLPRAMIPTRLHRASAPTGILLRGYDLLGARQICADIGAEQKTQARLVFGGRELLLARQGAPAWEWLMVSVDAVATNLLGGGLTGIFVGGKKTVIGLGLEKASLTDPARLAATLMESHQARFKPVVLFVSPQHQQRFFEFFSSNPLPGVFLSFDQADVVRDVLNKQARFSSHDRDGALDYYCY